MIAPGLAITAKHVIEAALIKYENFSSNRESKVKQEVQCSHNSLIIQVVNGKECFMWSVKRMFLSRYTDAAFLQADALFDAKELPIKQKLAINLNPPEIGDRIVAFGYPNSRVKPYDRSIKINLEPRTSVGEVVEVHQNGRDRMLPFPVFRTNARFDPGMSGGAVFNNSGGFCSIVCSNMPPMDPADEHVSYVALLWPSMATLIQVDLANHTFEDRFPALFLAEHSYIEAKGWQRVMITSSGKPEWKTEKNNIG